MVKTPEEMLEIYKKRSDSMEDGIYYQRICREFIPYAAKEIIELRKVKGMLREIVVMLNDDKEKDLAAIRKFKAWNQKAVDYLNSLD